MPLFNSSLITSAADDSTPAEDPVTRSLRFDGSSYLSRVTGSTSTTWTISMWFKRGKLAHSVNQYLAAWNTSEGVGFRGTGDTGNVDKLSLYDGSGHNRSAGVYRDPSAWAHICVSVNSGTGTVYYNGESIISGVSGIGAWGTLRIGDWASGTTNAEYFGIIADVYGIEGSALDHTSFSESNDYGGLKPKAYTGSFGTNGFHIDAQPAHDSDLMVSSVGRNNGDTDFVDVAAGHVLTKTGSPQHSIKVGNPFTGNGRAIYFDGTDDYLTVDDGTNIDLGTGDFTIEFWMNSDEDTQNAYVTGRWNATPNGGAWDSREWGLTCTSYGGGELDIYIPYTGGYNASSLNVCDGKWHHIAIVRHSSDAKLYVDGEYKIDATVLDTYNMSFSSKLLIGGGQSLYWRGAIYDYRISDTARYTSGTSDFDVPTEKFTSDSNTLLLIQPDKDDTTFHDESSSPATVTTVSSPTRTASSPYEAAAKSTAMYFSGSSDSVKTTASSDFAFGTGDFTIEGWWYFNTISSSSDAVIVDLRPANDGTTTAFSWSTDTDQGLKIYRNGSSALGGSLSTETWHHLALVRSSGTVTAYIDGVPTGTTLDWSSVDLTTNGTPRLGAAEGGGSVNLDGYVFDVRITKGTARYTSNFSSSLQSAPFELNPVYIGGDQSGNKNHFAPTGISAAHDVLIDNPFKNHPTWNPLVNSSNTFTEGNLKVTTTSSTPAKIVSTIGASSGKWYAEVLHAGQDNFPLGITADNQERDYLGNSDGNTSISFWPGTTSTVVYINGSSVTFSGSGTTWANGDIIGIALNADDKEVSLYKNGSLVGAAVSYSSYNWTEAFFAAGNYSSGLVYHANFGADPTFAGGYTGTPASSEWAYSPPNDSSGNPFKSLNTSNLDAPAVTPSENFEAKAYEGEGGSEEINLGFTPALTWIKRREDSGDYWHGLYDSARGLSAGALASNSKDNEDNTQRVASFDSDTGSEGFTLSSSLYSYTNTSGKDFISWNWKAHQTPSASASYSDTLTLTVSDYSYTTGGWGNTKLKVYEGTAEIGEVEQPTTSDGSGGYSNTWDIKTNDPQKIKIVWDCDSTFSDWEYITATLDDDDGTNLVDYYYDDGDASTEFSDGDTFYQHSSYSTANESTTGTVVAGGGTTVSSNSEKYNAAAGFTMFTYTGNSDSQSDSMLFNHSLGVPLDFIICKNRDDDSTDWLIWHKDLGDASYQIFFDEYPVAYSTESSGSGFFTNKTDDTQHQVELTNIYWTDYSGSGFIQPVKNNKDFIFYGWAGVEGYSKFGSYTGNADDDGPMVFTGFRPRYLMIKNVTTSATNYGWYLVDSAREPANEMADFLMANSPDDEDTAASNKVDFLSNGFKIRGDGNVTNQNNQTMVYIAFAELPFKYSNAK